MTNNDKKIYILTFSEYSGCDLTSSVMKAASSFEEAEALMYEDVLRKANLLGDTWDSAEIDTADGLYSVHFEDGDMFMWQITAVAQPADLEEDRYFIYPDKEKVEAIYYNPDADAGGQFVCMTLPFELIAEAKRAAGDSVDTFFCHLDTYARTELVDRGTPEFDEMYAQFRDGTKEPAFVGRNMATMAALVDIACGNAGGAYEFECETTDCAYNKDGLCRFSAVFGEKPEITEKDGCLSGIISFFRDND